MVNSGSTDSPTASGNPVSMDPVLVEAVQNHLQRILASEPFRSTQRSRAFLEFVVARKLEGREDLLKERTIGVEIFGRSTGYETATDPIVRVKATEVRKRLAQFYESAGRQDPIYIALPPGSYMPVFHRKNELPAPEREEEHSATPTTKTQKAWGRRRVAYLGLAVTVLAIVVASVWLWAPFRSEFDDFWAPVFASPQPVLVCLGKNIRYEASLRLQAAVEAARQHSGNIALFRLMPDDLVQVIDGHVSKYNLHAALALERLFTSHGKASQFRVGPEVLLDEMRDQPAVIIGAFSNPPTLQITRDLRFTFEYDPAVPSLTCTTKWRRARENGS